ncbi:hypothetical protein [Sphingosinicella rhizophila]|uniref:Uncharacterized protein n=1 Tax=Sphingosinicella rhizophila TaxID=3050082 RepID=A0ABU3Q390_9SPHN|nr:hypothetical protein [Sphingosinicella sp. GR2756]MDT9597737.1 hypothetical protein [Sphingosinicella sp. GR2756]
MEKGHEPRLFPDDASIRHVGEGLLACTFSRAEWTHEAHLAACVWILVERPDLVPERDLPDVIRRFNESVGGVNDDYQGYHDTVTACFIAGVRLHLARCDARRTLAGKVNGLLLAPQGRRDWPLRFYSPDRLVSIEARRSRVEPDLQPLPDAI